MPEKLEEKLSFDQLFRVSDPKRVARSFKVRGPPLDIDSYRDAVYYIFNFKANPSTTGLRHKGYVKFLRPKNPKRTPLQNLDCIVDCTCPDYRYRWAWANKQRGASLVGGKSLNQAFNRAPKKTNPAGIPGLCKHILATREYIYGLLSSFPGDEPDTADKLEKLTRYATKRWANYKDLVAQAKERERQLQRQIALRRITGKPVVSPEVEKVKLEPPKPAEPIKPTAPAAPPRPFLKTGAAIPPGAKPGPAPAAKGPEPGEQRMFLRGEQPYTKQQTPAPKPTGPAPEPKKQATFLRQQLPRGKREENQNEQNTNPLMESVFRANAEFNMTTLTEATKLVEEMMDDDALTDLGPSGAATMDVGEPPVDDMGLEPSEPPVSDSAIGADTEAETALGLLRQMRDLLAQLVVGEPGEEEMMAGAEAVPGAPGEEVTVPEMPGEPPVDEEVPVESGEGEGEEHKPEEGGGKEEKGETPGEGGSEEEEESKRKNRRPSAD